MLSNTTTARTGLVSALVLSAVLATPVLAETASNTAAAVQPTRGLLPAIEETIIVSEVDLEPITLASKILDSDAYMKDGTKIGDVSDLVLDGENRATAIIVGVGGFLGIDEKHIAIPISKVTFERDGRTLRVVADITKDELKKAEKSS